VDTIDDMAALFAGIESDADSVSIDHHPTAIICSRCTSPWRRIGYDLDNLSGPPSDILKDTWEKDDLSIRPSLRLVGHDRVLRAQPAPVQPDQHQRLPHQRSGSELMQELAFTFCNAVAYLDESRAGCGRRVRAAFTFFFAAQQDFSKSAKFRAARASGEDRQGAVRRAEAESMRLRFTARPAASLTRSSR